MSNKTLGTLAFIGSPWLFLGPYIEQRVPGLEDSWFTGVWGILFISGWICSVIVLRRLKTTGSSTFGKVILVALIAFLTLANLSNLIQIIVEKDKPAYFMLFDIFWPLSNLVMLVMGVAVILIRGLPGWKRYVPLAVGMWFPLAMISSAVDDGVVSLFFGGIYSALAWGALAVVVMTTKEKELFNEQLFDNPG